jgi:hypothetical protein
MGPNQPDLLVKKYIELKAHEREAMLHRRANAIWGPSVVRVFRKGTKKDIEPVLLKLDLNQLERCQKQGRFDAFFYAALSKVDKAILLKNRNNSNVAAGHK